MKSCRTVLRPRRLVTGVSLQRPGCDRRILRVGFILDKVEMGQVSLRVHWSSPVSYSPIAPPTYITSSMFCRIVQILERRLINHKNLKIPCSLVGVVLKFRRSILDFHFCREDGGSMFLRNVVLLPYCTLLQPRKPQYKRTNIVTSALCSTNRDFTECVVRRHCQNCGGFCDTVICFFDAELDLKFTYRFAKACSTADVRLKEVSDYIFL